MKTKSRHTLVQASHGHDPLSCYRRGLSTLTKHQNWTNQTVVQQLNDAEQTDSHAQTQNSTTVGNKVRPSKQFVALHSHVLSLLEVNRQLGKVYAAIKVIHSIHSNIWTIARRVTNLVKFFSTSEGI